MDFQDCAQVSDMPAAGQNVHHDGKKYTTIKEGLAYILIPASSDDVPSVAPRGDSKPQSVFYNPIQQFNRDLSVLAIKAFGEELIEKRRAKMLNKKRNMLAKQSRKRKIDEVEETGTVEDPKVNGTNSNVEKRTVEDMTMVEKGQTIACDAGNSGQEANKPTTEAQTSVTKDSPAQETTETLIPPTLEVPSLPFRILDALSATGLRALRYAHEIPFVTSVTAHDLI
jgi:tRNA (guanine26-N2/guanine27-N2)-dimethyltransferase